MRTHTLSSAETDMAAPEYDPVVLAPDIRTVMALATPLTRSVKSQYADPPGAVSSLTASALSLPATGTIWVELLSVWS
jgi:hypothetical protein